MSSTPEGRPLQTPDGADARNPETTSSSNGGDRWGPAGQEATPDFTGAEPPTGRPGIRIDRHEVQRREKEAYGGVKVGAAFFGWLSATGMAVILTAVVAAAGAAVGVATNADVSSAAASVTSTATANPGTVGTVGAIALALIIFLSYYAGGYVAGRMARFNGARQGVAVWVWALVIAGVVAIVTAIAGSKYDILQRINSFPRLPLSEGNLSTAGIIALLLVAVTSLVGAMLGGLAGMRYHRKIDRAGLDGDITPREV